MTYLLCQTVLDIKSSSISNHTTLQSWSSESGWCYWHPDLHLFNTDIWVFSVEQIFWLWFRHSCRAEMFCYNWDDCCITMKRSGKSDKIWQTISKLYNMPLRWLAIWWHIFSIWKTVIRLKDNYDMSIRWLWDDYEMTMWWLRDDY